MTQSMIDAVVRWATAPSGDRGLPAARREKLRHGGSWPEEYGDEA